VNRDELRALQAPLKERYAEQPAAALVTLSALGTLGEHVSCSVQNGRAIADDEQLAALQRLTERYCVVYRTLTAAPALSTTFQRAD
jgi:hypothetical protein